MQKCIRVNTPCSNNQKSSDVHQAILPDSRIMKETHGELLILNPLLKQAEFISHIFPHLQLEALISIGQLCNDVCIATFTATHLHLFQDGLALLEGSRSYTSGMYQINLTSNPTGIPIQNQSAAINALEANRKPEINPSEEKITPRHQERPLHHLAQHERRTHETPNSVHCHGKIRHETSQE